MKKFRPLYLIPVLLILLIPVSLCIGRYPIPFTGLFGALFQPGAGSNAGTVLRLVRLPRIASACFVGAALSVSGTVFQQTFHNPMATPDLLGTTSGSCFGAALAILLGFSPTMTLACSFFGGLLSVLLILMICLPAGKREIRLTLILVGIVVGSLFTAATSAVKLLADQENRLPAITYWMMGSLSGITGNALGMALIPAVPAGILLFALRRRLNLLRLSDEEIRSVGVRPAVLRGTAIVCASLLTASAVSVSGQVGWVGLVIPNLCRRLTGSDCRRLLPLSALTGAFFLLAMDDLARTVLTVEIPLGILTAVIGAPCFLVLFLGKGRVRDDND